MKLGLFHYRYVCLLRQNLEGNSRAGGWFFQGWVPGIFIREERQREGRRKGVLWSKILQILETCESTRK